MIRGTEVGVTFVLQMEKGGSISWSSLPHNLTTRKWRSRYLILTVLYQSLFCPANHHCGGVGLAVIIRWGKCCQPPTLLQCGQPLSEQLVLKEQSGAKRPASKKTTSNLLLTNKHSHQVGSTSHSPSHQELTLTFQHSFTFHKDWSARSYSSAPNPPATTLLKRQHPLPCPTSSFSFPQPLNSNDLLRCNFTHPQGHQEFKLSNPLASAFWQSFHSTLVYS